MIWITNDTGAGELFGVRMWNLTRHTKAYVYKSYPLISETNHVIPYSKHTSQVFMVVYLESNLANNM